MGIATKTDIVSCNGGFVLEKFSAMQKPSKFLKAASLSTAQFDRRRMSLVLESWMHVCIFGGVLRYMLVESHAVPIESFLRNVAVKKEKVTRTHDDLSAVKHPLSGAY